MLEVQSVSVEVNGRRILSDVSLKLERGLSLIAGPNGSGKTTLLKTIAGLVRPSSGRIMLDGSDITNERPNKRFRLGIVLAPERLPVARELSVEENLSIVDAERAYEFFPELRKIRTRRGKELSGGERQMVVLARAFAANPKWLLLDEPFYALHGIVRKRVVEVIEEFSKKIGVAVVTHDEIEALLDIASHLCILVGGAVKFSGKKEDGEKLVRRLFLP